MIMEAAIVIEKLETVSITSQIFGDLLGTSPSQMGVMTSHSATF